MTPYDKAFLEGQKSVLDALSAVADNHTLHRRTRRTIRAVLGVFEAEISRKQGSEKAVHLASSPRAALSTRREEPPGSSGAPRG